MKKDKTRGFVLFSLFLTGAGELGAEACHHPAEGD